MRRLTSWLAIVTGTLLLLVGLGAAVYAGPSGTVRIPGGTVPGGAPVTVLSDALTRYSGTTLRVTASAGDQRVFIGAAHPVDATSYVAGGRVAVVDQVTTSGITSHVEGKADVRPGTPAGLDIWTHHVDGAGEQVLDVPLDGQPVRVVVQTASKTVLTLSVGFGVAGLFPLALVLAVAGAGLVALGVVLRRRSRGPRAGDPADGVAAPEAHADDSAAADEPADAGVARRTTSRAARAAGVGIVAAVALGGCVSVPQPVGAPAGPVTKVAMTRQALTTVLTDYDKRNNAVIASLVRKLDVHAWDAVDSGPVLASDRQRTAFDIVDGVKRKPATLTHTPHEVWAPTVTAYPQWFAATVTSTVTPAPAPAKGAAAKDQLYLLVMRRQSARSPWTMHFDVPIERAPAHAPTSGTATASVSDVERAVEGLKDVVRWFEGRPVGSITPGTMGTNMRAYLREKISIGTIAGVTCQPYLRAEKPQASARVVRTSTGLLTVATLQCQASYAARPGHSIGWQAKYAKALGTSDGLGALWTRTYLVTVAIESKGKKNEIIGATRSLARIADLDLA